jgi:hypothetical protein
MQGVSETLAQGYLTHPSGQESERVTSAKWAADALHETILIIGAPSAAIFPRIFSERDSSMTASEHFSSVGAVPHAETSASLSSSIKSFPRLVAMWANTCADYFAAAAIYEQLSGLSDAELHKRGLSRDTLARDVCECCDRTASG